MLLTLLIIALIAFALGLLPSVSPAHILAEEQVQRCVTGVTRPVSLSRKPSTTKSLVSLWLAFVVILQEMHALRWPLMG